ncbi:MAG TPA: zinc metalloprotease HtpX [Chitinivibrionales bacterium]|jgi:heat shock protein HtpX|nr:zinc metalloprotease HtpX [Chitinivibrionales bacterium]
MNYLKTTLLLGILTCILAVIGQYIGGTNGAVGFFVFAAIMNLVAYWFSDKLVLMTYHARRVSEQDAPVLYRVVRRLAQEGSLPMPKVYIVDNPTPNAFATGRSPQHASVAATTGILKILSEDELEGVMSHELSHVKNRDILIASIAATIAGAITMIGNVLQWGAMFGASAGRDEEDRGGMVGMIAMAILAPFAAMIVQLAISRSREYAADAAGARLCHKPLSLAHALGKLEQSVKMIPMQGGNPSTAHLFIVNPFRGGLMGLFSTHPPMEERIRRLEAMAGDANQIK